MRCALWEQRGCAHRCIWWKPAQLCENGSKQPYPMHNSMMISKPCQKTALLIIGNEFFDALPVRQSIKTEAGWREVMVGLGDDKRPVQPISGQRPTEAWVPAELQDAPVGSIHESAPGLRRDSNGPCQTSETARRRGDIH